VAESADKALNFSRMTTSIVSVSPASSVSARVHAAAKPVITGSPSAAPATMKFSPPGLRMTPGPFNDG